MGKISVNDVYEEHGIGKGWESQVHVSDHATYMNFHL